jgi:hypothetical protein
MICLLLPCSSVVPIRHYFYFRFYPYVLGKYFTSATAKSKQQTVLPFRAALPSRFPKTGVPESTGRRWPSISRGRTYAPDWTVEPPLGPQSRTLVALSNLHPASLEPSCLLRFLRPYRRDSTLPPPHILRIFVLASR